MNTIPWISKGASEPVDLRLFQARFEDLVNPRNEEEVRILRLSSPDACNVLPVLEDGRFLLVRQYRFGTGTFTLEIPGGLLEPGELPEQGARRELREETGYQAQRLEYLGKVPSNPVFLDCYIHHFVATGVSQEGVQVLDPAEDIELVALDRDELMAGLRSGDINHPHTLSALMYFLFLR